MREQKTAARKAAQQSPNLRAIHEATQLIHLLDERTEDLEQGMPRSPKAAKISEECLTGWRELGEQEIKQLPTGSHLQVRRRHSDDPPIEVRMEMKLLATGEPSSWVHLWLRG